MLQLEEEQPENSAMDGSGEEFRPGILLGASNSMDRSGPIPIGPSPFQFGMFYHICNLQLFITHRLH